MAISTCAKCGSHFFELKEVSPSGSNFKLFFVQCSICGVPVATQDFYNLGALIHEQTQLMNHLKSRIDNIEHQLRVMSNQLRR